MFSKIPYHSALHGVVKHRDASDVQWWPGHPKQCWGLCHPRCGSEQRTSDNLRITVHPHEQGINGSHYCVIHVFKEQSLHSPGASGTHVHTHVHTCIDSHMHTRTHRLAHIFTHMCTHRHIHTCVHTCVDSYMHTHIHTHVHTCIDAPACTHTRANMHVHHTNVHMPAYICTHIMRSVYKRKQNTQDHHSETEGWGDKTNPKVQ